MLRTLRVKIAAAASLLLFLAMAQPAAQPQVKAYFFDPDQIGRGQTVALQIAGEKFTDVLAVKFEPASGITIGDVKPVEKMRKAQCWSVDITVAQDAALGKRSVTVTTPEGVITKRIEVVPQPVPIISDLKILKASTGVGVTIVDFTFQVAHGEGTLGKRQQLSLDVASTGFQLLPGFSSYSVYTKKIDPADSTHSVVTAQYSPLGNVRSAGWLLRVSIKDNNKRWSNTLEAEVSF